MSNLPDERRGEVAEVLAQHTWHHTATTHCACGWRSPLAQLAVSGYHAHVADALAPMLAGWLAGAWDEGWGAAKQVVDFEDRKVWAHTVMPEGYEGNPYRQEKADG